MNNKGNIRGGSWDGSRGRARLGCRDYDVPVARNKDLGFRVAVHNIKKTTVLRGGSWLGSQVFARAAIPLGDLPDYRYDDLGFRIKQTS